jgi:hypothetical protein
VPSDRRLLAMMAAGWSLAAIAFLAFLQYGGLLKW